MKKYLNIYSDRQDYNSESRPTDGSVASKIGPAMQYDGVNVEVLDPEVGDAVYHDNNGKIHYFKHDTIRAAQMPNIFTPVGVVLPDPAGRIRIGYINGASKKWADVFRWVVTGSAMTDGAEHTAAFTANSVSVNVTWQAEDIETFAAAVQAAIGSQSFGGHAYSCYVDDDKVYIQHDTYTEWKEPTFAGLTLTRDIGTKITADSNAYKENGVGSEGAVYSISRAISVLSSDRTESWANPTTDVAGETTYPVCLPAYLGESAVAGADHCAWLRAKYGEGYEGWINYLKHMMPRIPASRGALRDQLSDGYKNTYAHAYDTYKTPTGVIKPLYPAFDYAAGINFPVEGLERGKWFVMSLREMSAVKKEITLGGPGVSAATADVINRTLNAMGGTLEGNDAYMWCSSRYYAYYAWGANAGYGYLSGNNFYLSIRVWPCVLLERKN